MAAALASVERAAQHSSHARKFAIEALHDQQITCIIEFKLHVRHTHLLAPAASLAALLLATNAGAHVFSVGFLGRVHVSGGACVLCRCVTSEFEVDVGTGSHTLFACTGL